MDSRSFGRRLLVCVCSIALTLSLCAADTVLSGQVVSAEGRPLEDVTLSLLDEKGELQQALSNESGRLSLSLKNPPESWHWLLQSPEGPALLELDASPGEGLTWVFPEMVSQTLEVNKPAEEPLSLELIPLPDVSFDALETTEQKRIIDLLSRVNLQVTVKERESRVDIKVARGPHLLLLFQPPFVMNQQRVEPGEPWTLTAKGGEQQRLRIQDGDGHPLQGAALEWAPARGRFGAGREARRQASIEQRITSFVWPRSDAAGQVSFGGVQSWDAGELSVSLDGYARQTLKITQASRRSEMTITLQPETRITGTLKSAPGIPLKDKLTLLLFEADENGRPQRRGERFTLEVTADESFTWSGLTGGNFLLTIFEGAPFRPRKEVTLQAGRTLDLGEWLIKPDQALLLTVTDRGGLPLEGAQVLRFSGRFWDWQKGRPFELPSFGEQEASQARTQRQGQGRARGGRGGGRWRQENPKTDATGVALLAELGEEPTRLLMLKPQYQATLVGPLEDQELDGKRRESLAGVSWFSGRLANALDEEQISETRLELLFLGEDDAALAISSRLQEDGTFLIGGVPAGPALLRITVPGFRTTERDVMVTPGAQTLDLGELRAEAMADPEIVFLDAVSGEPLPEVTASEWRGFRGAGDNTWGPSDEDGVLRLRQAPEGDIRLMFTADGYAQQEVRWLLPFPEEEGRREVRLKPGGSLKVKVTGLTESMDGFVTITPSEGDAIREMMSFSPDKPESKSFFLVAGPVEVSLTEFGGGRTLEAAPVTLQAGQESTALIDASPNEEQTAALRVEAPGLSWGSFTWAVSFGSDSGWHELQNGEGEAPRSLLSPGSRTLSLRGYQGRMPYNSDIQIDVSAQISGEGPALVALPGGSIFGRLQLPDDTDPGSVSLVAQGMGVTSRSRIGADGRFTLAGLPQGRYQMTWMRGTTGGLVLPDLPPVDVMDGEPVDLGDLEVAQEGSVELSVRGSGGEPLGDVRVTTVMNGSPMQLGRTDTSGRLTVHMKDPLLDVQLSKTGYARMNLTLDSREPDLSLVMAEEALLQVRVLDLEGNPLVNAMVTVEMEDLTRQGKTDEGGLALISQLPAGLASVTAAPPGSIPSSPQEVELSSGQFATLTFGGE